MSMQQKSDPSNHNLEGVACQIVHDPHCLGGGGGGGHVGGKFTLVKVNKQLLYSGKNSV